MYNIIKPTLMLSYFVYYKLHIPLIARLCFKPPNGQVFHWWGFQLGFEIFEMKFKETWNFAEYIEEKSWDNPTTFLTLQGFISLFRQHFLEEMIK